MLHMVHRCAAEVLGEELFVGRAIGGHTVQCALLTVKQMMCLENFSALKVRLEMKVENVENSCLIALCCRSDLYNYSLL